MKKEIKPIHSILRQKAEELLKMKTINPSTLNADPDMLRLIHELEVHQIELEMQNEELQLAKNNAENASDKYSELYDFAPSGYFTLSKYGDIIELNLHGSLMLGRDRSYLINRRFASFVTYQTIPLFIIFLDQVFLSKTKQICEIALLTDSNLPVDVQLTGIVSQNGENCLVTAIDITEHNQSEIQKIAINAIMNTVLDSTNSPVFSLDCDLRYTSFNKAHIAEMKFLYGADIKIGESLLNYQTVDEDREGARKNLNRVLRGEKIVESAFSGMPGTQRRYFEVIHNPIFDVKGEVIGISVFANDLTERKKWEEELKESERFLKETQLIANIGTYSLDFSSGKWVSSEVLDTIFGIDADFDRSVEGWVSIIHPEWQSIMADYLNNEVIGNKTKFDKEYKIIRINDGAERWLHGKGKLKFDYNNQLVTLVGTIKDITERKQSEEALRKSEEKYRFMFFNNPQPMFIYDLETLDFLEVNQSAINHYGYTRDEFLTMTLKDIRSTDDIPDLMRNIDLVRQGYLTDGESLHTKKNGDVIIVEIKAHTVNFNGRNARHVLINDISRRKKAETEIVIQNEDLKNINSEKDKFFSIIAHDLRGPFSAFLGLTKIMAEELPSLTMPEIQDIARNMKNSAANLFRLLENLLHWSRMRQGLIPFKPEEVNLSLAVSDSIEMIQESARNKGIEIVYDIPSHLEVFADSNMLQTVLRNLVSNAVKFSHRGGNITISAIVIPDRGVEIFVRDTGIGMSPTLVGDLFKLDVKTNRRGTADEPSTGLGLLLCKEFIEKHGGKFWVESVEGKGSTFYFILP